MKNTAFRRMVHLGIIFISLHVVLFSQQEVLEPAVGKNGMVSTAHPLATETALRILKEGGNAIDAAVAAAFAIGVVEPDGSGLGGGGCMTIYLKDLNETHYINYYQKAPGLVDEIEYSRKIDKLNAKTALVPGTTAGLITALENYGTLDLSSVTKDAVRYAANGFEIDNTLAGIILDNLEVLQQYKETSDIFLPDGFPLMEGDTLKQSKLANTLKVIAAEGKEGFYDCYIATQIVNAINEAGNKFSLEDLKNYNVKVTDALKGTYRGYEIFSANAPQSGATIIQTMNMLEEIDFKELGHFTESAEVLHLMSEVFLRSYADRYFNVGDPDFSELPLELLTSKSFAKERFLTIDKSKTGEAGYRKTPEGFSIEKEEQGHTTHISIIDKDGNMVSLTQTLGTFFGCGFSVEGILFNSSYANFSSKAEVNKMGAGRQPRSTIAPTIILKDGKPFMCLGTPGGGRIIATLSEIMVNVIDFGMNAEEANQAPRFYCQVNDDFLNLEGRISEPIRAELENKGHHLKLYEDFDLFFGGAQFIIVDWDNHEYFGTADKRRGGMALGY
ncbi:MAG: gamma-glutamyltransferase [Bacteroidetes bacterium]|nr:gamma-glutamyltransferase [Bacteroidota bacterium]